MEALKFNLSFKQDEAELYKEAITDQRAPGAFIKDAIEFYLNYLKGNGVFQLSPKKQLSDYLKEEDEHVSTEDLLDF